MDATSVGILWVVGGLSVVVTLWALVAVRTLIPARSYKNVRRTVAAQAAAMSKHDVPLEPVLETGPVRRYWWPLIVFLLCSMTTFMYPEVIRPVLWLFEACIGVLLLPKNVDTSRPERNS